ncbi:hypothetical protein bcere0026_9540 [Bacillus mycoides]|uniref:Cysteine-rich CPCC domain-containing protein n=1 Tax=Bacillus mycoides TaxID=1405 RepID=C2XQJ7_BACMY|nr:hypothetical protein bcere0026_9540 [Bacillus mycoides]
MLCSSIKGFEIISGKKIASLVDFLINETPNPVKVMSALNTEQVINEIKEFERELDNLLSNFKPTRKNTLINNDNNLKGDKMNNNDMNYICLICGFDELLDPSYEICSCCGFQFGYDDCDQGYTFIEYRKEWLKKGAIWFNSAKKPARWSLEKQLKNIE